ncbi:unnamed protein product [Prorocentrum cordatum]|uniref:Uncharacterized protein n=1 Tax=Prorocentrum cordatum TaxID=2364126 RepID=A0ABN9U2H1_9DINO|nr:unnamed protein product [Polarella glacialis]
MSQDWRQLVSDLFTEVIQAEAGGASLIPPGISEPRDLATVVFRRLIGDRDRALTKQSLAEQRTVEVELERDALRDNLAEVQKVPPKLEKDLAKAQAQVVDYEMRIAFLGERWETLTGEVNSLSCKDPQARVRALDGEVLRHKTALFNADMKMKVMSRDMRLLADTARERQERLQSWTGELLSSRQQSDDSRVSEVGLKQQVKQLGADAADAQAKQAEAEAEAKTAREKLAGVTERLTAANRRVGLLEDTIRVKNSQLAKLDKERLDSLNVADVVAKDNASLKDDWTQSKGLVAEFQGKYSSSQDELARSAQKQDETLSLLRSTESRLEQREADLKALRSELAGLREELRVAQRCLEEERALSALQRGDLARLGGELAAARAAEGSARKAEELCRGQLRSAQEALGRARSDAEQLGVDFHRAQEKLGKARAEAAEEGQQARRLGRELQGSRAQLEAAREHSAEDCGAMERNATHLQRAEERRSASPQHTSTMSASPPPRGDARTEKSYGICVVAGAFWPHRSGNDRLRDG